MVEIAKEAKETHAEITTMVLAERIDESGGVHPQRTVTLDYVVEQ